MKCPQCDHDNPADAKRCERCQTLLGKGLAGATLIETPTVSGATSETAGTEAAARTSGVVTGWSVPPATPAEGQGGLSGLQPGGVLGGRYEILQLLGEGGMGAVYKARDVELDRVVAVKVIRPELVGRAEILQRFKQELILARKVTHKNVIRIFDLGQAGNIKFITMEFVEGADLKQVLRVKRKLEPKEAGELMLQVARALEAAHAEGVIHRDLKPQNIMIEQESGRVLVMDFGIARSVESQGMTQTGALMGTPEYMSPEQAKGEKLDHRSDLFTFGIIFYELLTGRSPYKSDTIMGSLMKRLQEPARPPIEADTSVPQDLSDLVSKCLQREPAERCQSAHEIVRALEDRLGLTPSRTIIATAPARVAAAARHWRWAAAGLAVVLLAIAGYLFRERFAPSTPATQKPKSVTVLVADFGNATGDPVFNGTLEPTFITALEGASFITSIPRNEARNVGRQLQPSASSLDESLARLFAVLQGIHYVVSGAIERQGDGYGLSVKAIQGATAKSILSDKVSVADKKGVLLALGKLAARVRSALGDDTPEALQIAAAENFTAASLEAAQSYEQGQRARFAGNFEEAIPHYLRAIELDPNFGMVYTVLGMTNRSLGRRPDALKFFQMALARIDRMSDREKYRTRGAYYLALPNPQKAIEEFSALVKQYPADMAGLNKLALGYYLRHDMSRALEEGRRALQVHPHNLLQRDAVAQYAVYAGDFETAVREERAILETSPAYYKAYRVIALAELARGRPAEAAESYRRLEAGAPPLGGPSYSAIGFADLFLYEGRPAEAVAILEKAVAADVANNNPAAAARKFATLAQAHLLLGRKAPALAAADRAIAAGDEVSVLFTAAGVYLDAGQEAKARALASQLANRLESDPQAFAKLLEGEALLRRGNAREAIKLFQESQKLADTWLGRFDLGRAYIEAGAFTEADSELELCLKRRGEATEAFLGQLPTYRYFPPVHYYQGRAREGLKSPSAAESYKAFLAIKEKAVKDPLVEDARRRLALAGR